MTGSDESRVRREAADWWSRLRTSDSKAVKAAFEAWRRADAAHDAAYLQLERRWDQSAFIAKSGVSRVRNLDLARPIWARPGTRVAAMAAAILLAVGLGAILLHRTESRGGPVAELRYVSAPGQVRTLVLANGSRIVLDADTAVALRVSSLETRAHLERGRARFAAASAADANLVVTADDRAFTARDGEFDVDVRSHMVSAVVWRGTLGAADAQRGSTPARSWQIGTHRRFSFEQSGQVHEDDAPRALRDWPQGMLSFEATRLGDAVATIDRYCRPKIAVADDLADLRLSGGFRARDCAGFVRTITTMFHAHVVRATDGTLRIAKKSVG